MKKIKRFTCRYLKSIKNATTVNFERGKKEKKFYMLLNGEADRTLSHSPIMTR